MSSSINILITGTPGSGKSTLCKELLERCENLQHIDISKFAIDNQCIEKEYDEKFRTCVLDEDRLLHKLKPILNRPQQTTIIDYHSCGLFENIPIDALIVLTTSNEIIAKRLTSRGYTGAKLSNNIEYEIFQMAVEEAYDTYEDDMIHVLPNCDREQLLTNVVFVTDLIAKLKSELFATHTINNNRNK